MDTSPAISWPRFAAFVRQHTHDIRNHLNGLDLEAALLSELINGDTEVKASVGRLRQQIRDISTELRALSGKFAQPSAAMCEVAVRDLFQIWKDQASVLEPPPQVEWRDSSGTARVSVDLEALARTFRELFANAVAFGTGDKLRAAVDVEKGRVAFKLVEPKAEAADASAWGKTPLVSTRRGGYGLGLWVADREIAASGGTITRSYDAAEKTLTTTLSFPAA
jgi:signal transduction histidine kinase